MWYWYIMAIISVIYGVKKDSVGWVIVAMLCVIAAEIRQLGE